MPSQLFLPEAEITKKETEIQGDVLIGLQKKAEVFFFFKITESAKFKVGLKAIIPNIATTQQTRRYEVAVDALKAWQSNPTMPPTLKPVTNPDPLKMVVKTNIAFSAAGLTKLGLPIGGAEASFLHGMEASIPALNDDGAAWLPEYKGKKIDGVILVAAWNCDIDHALTQAKEELAVTLSKMNQAAGATVLAKVREEEGKLNRDAPGHEMFGFADGVSQPAVEGLHRPVTADDQSFAGQDIVKLGDFVLGTKLEKELKDAHGDNQSAKPPHPWMENGSYMVFRRLKQDVKGFDHFTRDENNWKPKNLATSSDEFAARIVGRWKDGTPLARNPDNPTEAPAGLGVPFHGETAPFENNDFEFGVQKVGQKRCPFNAHIRRVYPRSDMQGGDKGQPAAENAEARRILRAGIAYDQSKDDKGLLFLCYQSSIAEKFDFIQESWANQDRIGFVPDYDPKTAGFKPGNPGHDLIIGQTATGKRALDWTTDRMTPGAKTLSNIPQFVTATGGEYFFTPSISGLHDIVNAP